MRSYHTTRHMGRAATRLTALVMVAVGLVGCLPYDVNEPAPRVVEGSYDAETRYDMQALSGVMTGAVRGWQSPELALRTKILERFESRYGAQIAGVIANTYGASIASDIRAYLQQLAPAWLLDMPSKLNIVDAQLKRFDVKSTILLVNQPDGSYKATQLWTGIALFRDPACRDAGGLACAQIDLSMSELLKAEYPLDLVSSTFEGRESGAARMMLTGDEVRFNYGRLALYLITNLALPDKPGAGLQLRDVVLAAINCRGVAGRLAGDDGVLGWRIAGVDVGLSLNDLIGSCEEGVFGMINDFVGQFNVPLTMRLTSALNLVDSTRDGRIDQLNSAEIDGTVAASLLNGSTREGPVSGQMTGWRVGGLPDEFGEFEDGGGESIDDGQTLWEANE